MFIGLLIYLRKETYVHTIPQQKINKKNRYM